MRPRRARRRGQAAARTAPPAASRVGRARLMAVASCRQDVRGDDAAMTDGTEGSSGKLRIGNAERNAAMKALDAHLEAGRLGVEEYGERSAVAAGATTASEL